MSLGSFHYTLRPSKNVERKMMCEALACLGRIEPIQNFRYIGFGSVEFVDFKLFHERFGITDLVNIESRTKEKKRVKFNQPYRIIQNKWGPSHKILPSLSWDKRTILWLDYTAYVDVNKLSDIALAASNLISGSVLIITLKAEPERVGNKQINKRRAEKVRNRINEKALPVPQAVLDQKFGLWGRHESHEKLWITRYWNRC